MGSKRQRGSEWGEREKERKCEWGEKEEECEWGKKRKRVSWERVRSANGENKKVRSASGEKERGVTGERRIKKREKKKES